MFTEYSSKNLVHIYYLASDTLNQRGAKALIRSICRRQRARYLHKNCSSCMISSDELSPSEPSQFPKHQVLDQIPDGRNRIRKTTVTICKIFSNATLLEQNSFRIE